MGSFTSLASKTIMSALFPAPAGSGTSNLAPNTVSDTTGAGFKIYNTVAATSTFGIFASLKATVDTRIDLILGSTPAAAMVNPITDAYIGANGLVTAGAGGNATAGNITFPATATYAAYTGMALTSATTGNHTWTGWTLSSTAETAAPIGGWRVTSVGQIGFPTNQTGTVNAWGFVLSSAGLAQTAGTAATLATGACDMPASNILLKTTVPAGGMPVIFAYGDLSSGRAINLGDTPVFTGGAIVITLD